MIDSETQEIDRDDMTLKVVKKTQKGNFIDLEFSNRQNTSSSSEMEESHYEESLAD